MYLELIKNNKKVLAYDWLDLEVLGSWLIMPGHCVGRGGFLSHTSASLIHPHESV